ncbi:MAG: CBS domain-containing protein, partial [Pseudomonadota bacterium]
KRYKHRAILVLDKAGKVVGKLSQNDVLRSLEPKYETLDNIGRVSHWELSPVFIKAMMKDHGLWEKPLDDVCRKAARRKVEEIMYTPAQGEYVQESATLNEAIHQLVIGHHQSLLVTSAGGTEVVGILKLTDVFSEVCDMIKACEI